MVKKTDARGLLEEGAPFSYKEGKDGRVFLYYGQRQVLTLQGKRAQEMLARL